MQAADPDADADTGLYTPIDSTPCGGTTSTNPRDGALRVSRHGLSVSQYLPAVRLS